MTKQILIVDDESGPRIAWSKALRYAKYQVEVAATAEKALTLCEEHQFDVVILDFLMPAMTGVELLVRIRKRLPLIRSIIVSGQLDPTVEESEIAGELKAAIEAGMYVHKPISNNELRDLVRQLLTRKEDTNWKRIADTVTEAQGARVKPARTVARRLRRHKVGAKKR